MLQSNPELLLWAEKQSFHLFYEGLSRLNLKLFHVLAYYLQTLKCRQIAEPKKKKQI